jgi:O-antigen ligase
MKTALASSQQISRVLWAAALVTLPVTSFRWFPFLGESTLIRPLALYPLALLLPFLVFQAWRGIRSFPRSPAVTLLAIFAGAVVVSLVLGIFINPVPLRGQTYSGRALRALATLAIGLLFYVSAAWMNRDESDLRFTLRWLLLGLALDLAWSGLQALTFYTPLLPKQIVTHWQLAFSMRELVRTNRISGLAYEPAWLAGQLATTYLPFLFASLLAGFRLTSRKWLEPALLILCALLILATYSRGGLFVAGVAAALTFLLLGRSLLRRAWTWFFIGMRHGWLLRVSLLASVLLVLAAVSLFLGQKNYFRRLWDLSPRNLTEYLVNINAGARSAYSTGAMAAFEEHPLAGVGLGASGFWIYQNLPEWSLTTVPEISRQLDPRSRLYPNPKNLYVRLLAETGLAGFVLFIVFFMASLADALDLFRRGGFFAFLGTAGLFAWLAIALYNVTQDSFATPNIWLVLGIIAGVAGAYTPVFRSHSQLEA